MLQPIEMHEIQDKTRLLDELNETRAGVNEALASVRKLSKEDKALNRIVKTLEERFNKLEDQVHTLMKAPKVKPSVDKPGPGPASKE